MKQLSIKKVDTIQKLKNIVKYYKNTKLLIKINNFFIQ